MTGSIKAFGVKLTETSPGTWKDRSGSIEALEPSRGWDLWFVSVHLGADRWADGKGKTLRAAERQCAADLRRIHRESGKWLERLEAAR